MSKQLSSSDGCNSNLDCMSKRSRTHDYTPQNHILISIILYQFPLQNDIRVIIDNLFERFGEMKRKIK